MGFPDLSTALFRSVVIRNRTMAILLDWTAFCSFELGPPVVEIAPQPTKTEMQKRQTSMLRSEVVIQASSLSFRMMIDDYILSGIITK